VRKIWTSPTCSPEVLFGTKGVGFLWSGAAVDSHTRPSGGEGAEEVPKTKALIRRGIILLDVVLQVWGRRMGFPWKLLLVLVLVVMLEIEQLWTE
jgi:hypothetical protein